MTIWALLLATSVISFHAPRSRLRVTRNARHMLRSNSLTPEPGKFPKVSRDGSLEKAEAAIDSGELEQAEAILVAIRAEDPHRDLHPRHYHLFTRLFREYAKQHAGKLWPLQGLAALYADAEEWELCHTVCEEGLLGGFDGNSVSVR